MPYVVPPRAKTTSGRDHQSLPARDALDQAADARLDRSGLHGDTQEAADHEDEERDVDRAEERPEL